MARNPRTNTKTTVTPNIRPVDTFVQPAPVDNTRLKELSSFLNNMIPRVNRYAQIEQGRRDKKDVLAAQEAFAKVTDKLLEYDELVKDGQLPPDQSPMFRFAFNQQQGAQAGLEFVRQANEAYIRSNLPTATSSNGFNDWFSNLQKDFVENNNNILRGIGSFDAFSGYARQAQQNLLTSHLSSVKKNFVKGAKVNHQEWLRKTINAIEANERLTRQLGTDAAGTQYYSQLGQSINQQINSLAKSSSGFISKTSLNEDTIDVIKDLTIAKGDFDWGKKILSSIKTTSGSSLADLPAGQIALYEARKEINNDYWTELSRNKEIREQFDADVKDDGQLRIFNMITDPDNLNPNQTVNVNKILDELANTVSQDADGKPIHNRSSDLEYFRTFYPEFEEKLRAEASTYAKQLTDENAPILKPEDEAYFLELLDREPANTQPRKVLELLNTNQIDYALGASLMKVAIANRKDSLNGINTEAFKDPIIKKYNSSKELSAAERYRARPKLENNRDSLWRKSVYELFHRRREGDGQKLWDLLSESEKESALNAIDKAIVQEQNERREQATFSGQAYIPIGINKYLRLKFGEDGKVKTLSNGSIRYTIEDTP